MSSIRDRVLARKLFNPIIKVGFPAAEPEFIFDVARFSPAEMECADILARRIIENEFNLKMPVPVKDQDGKPTAEVTSGPGIATVGDYLAARSIAHARYIQRHVKGWEHKVESPLEFNPANLAAVFESLSVTEMADLSAAWIAAQDGDEKKPQPQELPPENS